VTSAHGRDDDTAWRRPAGGTEPGPPPGQLAVDTRARIVPGSWENLREDFAKHEPTYIVDAESGQGARYPVGQFPAFREFLTKEYKPVAQTAEGVIYKRDPTKSTQLTALLR